MSNRHVKISRPLPIVNWFFDIIFVMSTSTIVVARALNMLRNRPHPPPPRTEALLKVVAICYCLERVHELIPSREFSFSSIWFSRFFRMHDLKH